MRVWPTPLLAAAIALLLVSPAAAMTVSEYLERTPEEREALTSPDGYLSGLRDGLYDYNAAMTIAGIVVFCPPEIEGPIDPAELKTLLETTIEQHRLAEPDFDAYATSTPLGLVGLEALTTLHACPEDEEETDELDLEGLL